MVNPTTPRLGTLPGRAVLAPAALLATLGLGGAGAAAQTASGFLLDPYFAPGVPGAAREPGTTVQSRARPQYDPLGVRAGDFVIRTQFEESLGYNSNVLGQPRPTGAAEVLTAGAVQAGSLWRRNSLGADLRFDDRRTLSVSNQDRTNWSASLGGTYEIGRDVLTLAGSHVQSHEDATDIDAARFNLPGHFSAAPLAFTVDDLRASYATAFGRFGVTPQLDYTRLRFERLRLTGVGGARVPAPNANGAVLGLPIGQSYRDRDLIQGSLTVRYAFAPLRDAVVVLRETDTGYVSALRDAFGPSRDGRATAVLAGLDYVANGVWRYRALVGYQLREFDHYPSHAAPVAEANVIWQPSGLTTVTARVQRSVEDAADENVSGYEYTQARITVDHEYRRNILLNCSLAYQRADYLNTHASETFYGIGAGVSWLVDRHVRMGVSSDVTQHQGSGGSGGNYLQSVTLMTLRLGY